MRNNQTLQYMRHCVRCWLDFARPVSYSKFVEITNQIEESYK